MYQKLSDEGFENTTMRDYLKIVKKAVSGGLQ